MADTLRTLTTLLGTTFVDGQAAGSIAAQQIRDLIVSLQPVYGGMYMVTPAATTIVTPGTYVKAAGTTAATNLSGFGNGLLNSLSLLSASNPRHVDIICTGTVTTAGTADNVSVAIAINGTVNDPSKQTIHMPVGTEALPFACHADLQMSGGSFISAWVTNEDAAATVTLGQMKLFAVGMLV